MAEVTEGDREKAAEMLDKAGIPHDERAWKLIHAIAKALAEEREKARAPFLAVLADIDDVSRAADGAPEHEHRWIDVTRIADRETHWRCALSGCAATRSEARR